MDYRTLFADVHRRPNAYFLRGTYRDAVVFMAGCDAINNGGLLIGFPQWLALKAECSASLSWPALVLRVTFPDMRPRGLDDLSEENDRKATEKLFSLIDEFLQERGNARGAADIITQYANTRRSGTEHQT
ncbi:hypothetical protein HDA32_000679 [Spinactinospora alkalitolerans]|uniref:Uncharacterized protein n=1 Tax=Spinactinospora alkalitolerans TaxID=687207 RepID=A0A852TNK9_9ACTN|nr:hypothetical protein [Spinactinospora alkalitolerans]NYE45559.1 hypothetical protein [Spinactinospora alkalitolerans]